MFLVTQSLLWVLIVSDRSVCIPCYHPPKNGLLANPLENDPDM